jgi:hypothetical protein
MCFGHHYLWRLGRNVGLEGLSMNTRFLKRVRAMFASYDAPPEVIRSYQRQWVRSVRRLGNNWLVAKPIERIEQ